MERKTLGIFAFAIIAILGISAVSAFGGFGNEMPNEDIEAMQYAIESGNYETWKSLKESQITEKRFNELQTRHQEREKFRALIEESRESGDYAKIQELKAEFGSGRGMHRKNMNPGECPFAE